MNLNQEDTVLDREWVELITEAKNLGLTFDEISLYLQTAASSEKE